MLRFIHSPLMTALFLSILIAPRLLFAESPVIKAEEKAGMGIGMTAGNVVLAPAKVASVGMGLFGAALSFVLTGGDTEVAGQMFRNSTEPPYLITPDLAQKALAPRPELQQR